jgi:hypothetical protein
METTDMKYELIKFIMELNHQEIEKIYNYAASINKTKGNTCKCHEPLGACICDKEV